MPCYTLVRVEVADEATAHEALKALGIDAAVQKTGNGVAVTPKTQTSGFEGKFRQEYGAILATKEAKKAGYTVTRKEENGVVKLVLRQY